MGDLWTLFKYDANIYHFFDMENFFFVFNVFSPFWRAWNRSVWVVLALRWPVFFLLSWGKSCGVYTIKKGICSYEVSKSMID